MGCDRALSGGGGGFSLRHPCDTLKIVEEPPQGCRATGAKKCGKCGRPSHPRKTRVSGDSADPKGPNLEKFQDLEIFKRA